SRREAVQEAARLADLDKAITAAIAPFAAASDKKLVQGLAQKIGAAAKQAIVAAKQQVDAQVTKYESAASPQTAAAAVLRDGATWVSISATGDAEGEANPLDVEDVDGIRRLAEAANKTLEPLVKQRTLVELSLGNLSINELPDPKAVPLELLAQLTPLARS